MRDAEEKSRQFFRRDAKRLGQFGHSKDSVRRPS